MILDIILGLFFIAMLAVVALIPWVGFTNFFNSGSVPRNARKKTRYMPIYKDKDK